jgi:hypothetical protein
MKPLSKAIAAAMSAEPDVAPPAARPRASSFTSVVSDLRVGDDPAARIMKLNMDTPITDLFNLIGQEKIRFGNNVRSSVAAAKSRAPGAEYTVEIEHMIVSSGAYLVALVTRKA